MNSNVRRGQYLNLLKQHEMGTFAQDVAAQLSLSRGMGMYVVWVDPRAVSIYIPRLWIGDIHGVCAWGNLGRFFELGEGVNEGYARLFTKHATKVFPDEFIHRTR